MLFIFSVCVRHNVLRTETERSGVVDESETFKNNAGFSYFDAYSRKKPPETTVFRQGRTPDKIFVRQREAPFGWFFRKSKRIIMFTIEIKFIVHWQAAGAVCCGTKLSCAPRPRRQLNRGFWWEIFFCWEHRRPLYLYTVVCTSLISDE